MIESMTGFGEGRAEGRRLRVGVTARSVNHRYLDLTIRMPEHLRRFEHDLRHQVRSQVQRGRVELRFDVAPLGEEERSVSVRHGVLRSYQEAINSARAAGLLTSEVTAGEMLRLPEVIETITETPEADEEDLRVLQEAAAAALRRMREARRTEGERLERSLSQILGELKGEVASLEASREQLRDELLLRLRERLSQLVGDVELQSDRLAMEVALLVERSDVQEELDRLASHIEGFGDLLEGDGPVGKKLDFLCQEILRELNTIGSKCRDTKAMAHVLEGKVVCEQLREQVQNIQ